ncbi:hypothetical protein GF357_00955 [Candidatus Dojkabacteria bacterium]|nr:hypothetical protein [Candidatus Dojkabacteria bacterium]
MNKGNKVRKIGKKASHRKSLISTQLTTLFEFGKLKTTTPKAKVVKGHAESFINKIKKLDSEVEKIRFADKKLNNTNAIKNGIKYIVDGAAKVTIARVSYRAGDNAELSELELVDFDKIFEKKSASKKSSKSSKSKKSDSKEKKEK